MKHIKGKYLKIIVQLEKCISKYFERSQITFQNRRIEFTRQRSVVMLFTVVSLEILTKHRAISSSTTNSTRNHPLIASMRRRRTTRRDASSASEQCRTVDSTKLFIDRFRGLPLQARLVDFPKNKYQQFILINPMINQSSTDNNLLTCKFISKIEVRHAYSYLLR